MGRGFETIGNATLVVHDDHDVVLATDPWVRGTAYFGSWGLSHEIPEAQHAAIRAARAIWFSHGHPDHLNPSSLPLFRDTRILVPDHVGGRIASDLRRDGYRVDVMPDRVWVPLSDRVRALCVTDAGQDAVLLVDVDGRLVVNVNDAQDRGWSALVKRVIREFPRSFLLRLSGYGDADMANFFDEDGRRVPSLAHLRKEAGFAVGADIARMAETFGVTHFVPFSSFHRYQRADSVWANEITTAVPEYEHGFVSDRVELLPAFVQYDCATESWTPLRPSPSSEVVLSPSDFGDDWAEELDAGDVVAITRYFRAIEPVARHLDAVRFRVGGREHTIDLGSHRRGRSVTFEVPRTSLMHAIEWEIFDDLLIGNFMKTTLHGRWPSSGLYPDFTPYVTKYADNGHARTTDELRTYFAEYRRRLGPAVWLRTALEQRVKDGLRSRLRPDSAVLRGAKRVYSRVTRVSSPRG